MPGRDADARAPSGSDPTTVVSVVIPTFRRPETLEACLISIAEQRLREDRLEVIVVDDSPGEEGRATVEKARGRLRQLSYRRTAGRGAAAARNTGAKAASGSVLVFSDDDMIWPRTLIEEHLRALRRFGRALVNAHWEFEPGLREALESSPFGRFRISVDAWIRSRIELRPLADSYLRAPGVTACNLAVRTAHFWEIGGFDDSFPYAGAEDQDFGLRAAARGFLFVYNPELIVFHNDGRLTLEQFCDRHRRGAASAARLALKYPAQFVSSPLHPENCELRRSDPRRVAFKKIVKQVARTSAARRAFLWTVRRVERSRPESALLGRMYWMLLGISIFEGYRTGLSRTQEARWPE